MTLSKGVRSFGFELEPGPFEVFTFTVSFYSGADLVGRVTQSINGYQGARLLAATSQEKAIDRVVVSGQADFAIAHIRYAQAKGLRIVEVVTPLPDQSFTTQNDENTVQLLADVDDPARADDVRWEVVDDPEDRVTSGTPQAPAGGLRTTLTIRSPGQQRWRAFAHPGALDQKALGYRIRAYYDAPGGRVWSDPVTVRQHAVDVVRQEYLDFQSARVPTRDEVRAGRPGYRGMFNGTGLGDYCEGGGECRSLHGGRLAELAGWLEARWDQPLQINSIYRNPVHHHVHMSAGNDSPHKYGTAIDYQAFGARGSRAQKLYWAALRNLGLSFPGGVCAEPYSLAPTHVHFDRRDAAQPRCPPTWTRPETPPGAAALSRGPARSLSTAAADTLLPVLADPDWNRRAAALGVLLAVPEALLPAGWQQAVLELLAREAAAAPQAEEEYAGYLLDLVLLATQTRSAAAVPGLVRFGLDAGAGPRRLVARYPEQALPLLDAAWNAEEARQADVLATYGEMLVMDAAGEISLTEAQRRIIDQRLFRAATGGVIGQWGFAFLVGHLRLAEWTPLVESLAAAPASDEDPLGLVPSVSADFVSTLRTTQQKGSPAGALDRLLQVQQALCEGASGLRAGQCTALIAHLRNAQRLLAAGQIESAAANLRSYRHLLDKAESRQVLSGLEYRLLAGNTDSLLARIG